MNTSRKGSIMKRLTLLTILVGLVFGTLNSVAALPPLQYYVRWVAPVRYTCTHAHGQYEMFVELTHIEYFAPLNALMTETDFTDNALGHFVTSQATELNWMNLSGTRLHTTYTIDSASYPITEQAVLKTFDNNVQVYQSTFTARCTGDLLGVLTATIHNNDHPPVFGIGSETNLTYSSP